MYILSLIFGLSVADAATLCGKEGQVIETEEYHFAVLGNTRPMDVKTDSLAGRVGKTKKVTETLLKM